MKNYLIEESGLYRIKINIDAENEAEAVDKLEEILDEELPIYMDIEVYDTQTEEYNK
jgi:hypothetical protein